MKKLMLTIDPILPDIAHIYGEDPMTGLSLGVNARRIVACVNACTGISTEQLENFTSLNILELVKKTIRNQ